MENTYLYIEPYVYINRLNNNTLLYNTFNGEYLLFNDNNLVNSIIDNILKNDKLLSYEVNDELSQSKDFKNFAAKIKEKYIGDIVKTIVRPVIFDTGSYYQTHIEFLNNLKEDMVFDTYKSFINEISFYLNSETIEQSSFLSNSYLQFLSPGSLKENYELSYDKVIGLIDDNKDISLLKVNITGGNFLKYPKIERLAGKLNSLNLDKSYLIYYSDLYTSINRLKELKFDNRSKLGIFITIPVNLDEFDVIIKTIKETNLNVNFNFIVENESDLSYFEKLIFDNNITSFNFKPFFTGNNIDFFKDNVFITKDDIFETKQSFKDIFKKKLVNNFNFGNLLIKSTGDIHADINNDKIGNIYNTEKISADLIKMAMTEGENWMKTRLHVEPCKNCIYNQLCPSISGYEAVFKRNNICKINLNS